MSGLKSMCIVVERPPGLRLAPLPLRGLFDVADDLGADAVHARGARLVGCPCLGALTAVHRHARGAVGLVDLDVGAGRHEVGHGASDEDEGGADDRDEGGGLWSGAEEGCGGEVGEARV